MTKRHQENKSRFGQWLLFMAAVCFAIMAIVPTTWAQPVIIEHMEYVKGDGEAIRLRQIEAFNEKYGDDIFIQFQPIDWSGFLEKFPVMIAAGVMPDVVLVPDELWHTVSSDIALDLMPYVIADGVDLEGMVPGVVDAAMEGDHLLALSVSSWVPLTEMAAYNMTMFNEAGMAYPDDQWTWEELIEYDRLLTRDVNGDGVVDFLGTDLGRHLVGSWAIAYQAPLYSYGGSIIADDLSRATINSDAARDVFPMLKQTADNFNVHLNDIGWEWSPMNTRQAAISVAYSSDILRSVSLMPGEIGTQVLPRGPEGYPYFRNPNPPSPGWAFIIAKQTKVADAAWQWVRFLTFEQEAIAALEPLQLATPPAIPYQPNLGVAMDIFSDDFRDNVFPTLIKASEVTQERVIDPMGGLQGPILESIRELLNKYFTDQINLPEFLENAELAINLVLQDNQDIVAKQRQALGID